MSYHCFVHCWTPQNTDPGMAHFFSLANPRDPYDQTTNHDAGVLLNHSIFHVSRAPPLWDSLALSWSVRTYLPTYTTGIPHITHNTVHVCSFFSFFLYAAAHVRRRPYACACASCMWRSSIRPTDNN